MMVGAGSGSATSAVAALLVLLLVCFAVLGGIVSVIASRKGRSPVGWFLFGGFFFLPALVTALLIKPSHQAELLAWVRDGGRLCEECRQPINFGAVRCHHCGVRQPEQAAEAIDVFADGPDLVRQAVEFFADELGTVSWEGVTGRGRLLDEQALLAPIGAMNRLGSERVQSSCKQLVSAAMALAAARSDWTAVDGIRMPRSWTRPYQVLADLGDDSPALIAFIERLSNDNRLGGPELLGSVASRPDATEVAYDVGEWTPQQLAEVGAALDAKGIDWTLDDNYLVVDHDAEVSVDGMVLRITGEGPTDVTWDPPRLPPPGPAKD